MVIGASIIVVSPLVVIVVISTPLDRHPKFISSYVFFLTTTLLIKLTADNFLVISKVMREKWDMFSIFQVNFGRVRCFPGSHSTSRRDLDLYGDDSQEIGGSCGTRYALQQSVTFPSLRSVRKKKGIRELMISESPDNRSKKGSQRYSSSSVSRRL